MPAQRVLFTLACALLLHAAAATAQTPEPPVEEAQPETPAVPSWLSLGGRVVSLSTRSRSITGPSYFSQLERLRLEADVAMSSRLSGRVVADVEGLLGSVLDTVEFTQFRTREPRGVELVTGNDLFMRARVYRGQIEYRQESLVVAAGRLRVPLGVARIFSPADLLNPFNPFVVEKEERSGVDGVTGEWSFGALAGVGGTYVPKSDWSRSSLAGRYEANVLGGAGVRGEATLTDVPDRSSFLRATVGADYAFRSGVRVLAEYYFNGDRPAALVPGGLVSHLNIATHNLGGRIAYDVTPLWTASSYVVAVSDGQGRFVNPELQYSLRRNVDLLGGAMLFAGGAGSALRRVPDAYYLRVEWFF